LLAALDARRVAPGPAGAPSRGRADVLPTGRNLTSIDPRAIPTRTAAAIGVRAADEVVRRYLQDHGEPPRALVIDLWASASLRTGGDDLAQALWYLGVKPVGQGFQSRHRHRNPAACRLRSAAHRRDAAHFRPVP
jgi:cobaltochelatase CobN